MQAQKEARGGACESCRQPLPVHHFPGAIPERQAVFAVRDGKRVHVPACPKSNPVNQRDEE